MHGKNILKAGLPLGEAQKVMILLHGRGGTAEGMLPLAGELNIEKYAILAPQAARNTWYPYSFLMPIHMNQPWLGQAIEMLASMEASLVDQGYKPLDIYFGGFSQGACLSLEYTAQNAKNYGGVIAFTGGLIGDKIEEERYNGDFNKTMVFIGTSDPDEHVPVSRVFETDEVMKKLHADTNIHIYKDMGHTINKDEIDRVNQLFF